MHSTLHRESARGCSILEEEEYSPTYTLAALLPNVPCNNNTEQFYFS